MTKYSIYKLTCETGKIYVGVTTLTIKRRLYYHKNKKYNTCSSKDFINPTIELLEEFETDDKIEKRKKEREYINKFDCVNIKKEILTPEEEKVSNFNRQKKYYDNLSDEKKQIKKEKSREYNKKYRELNREKLNEYDRLKYLKKKNMNKE